MWSVAAPRSAQQDSAPIRRDPAPSKLAYRYHRMMLRPLTRRLLTRVLPVGAVLGATVLWTMQPAQKLWIEETIARAWSAVENRPEFRVSGMAIEGASPELSAVIRAAIPLDFPLSQFELDLEALREVVLELPPVQSAALHVRSGGVLEVRVQERLPVALWRTDEGLHLIDAEGTVTADLAHRADRADLPLLAGAGAAGHVAEARALIAAAAPIEGRVRALVRRGERRWDLLLDRDQAIMLPARAPVEALERVVALHQATELLERDLTAVDLRVAHRPTLRLTEAANKTLRAARVALSEEK